MDKAARDIRYPSRIPLCQTPSSLPRLADSYGLTGAGAIQTGQHPPILLYGAPHDNKNTSLYLPHCPSGAFLTKIGPSSSPSSSRPGAW